jgi:hypothetical protein
MKGPVLVRLERKIVVGSDKYNPEIGVRVRVENVKAIALAEVHIEKNQCGPVLLDGGQAVGYGICFGAYGFVA